MSERSFTVVDARGTDGCATKYSVSGHGGRYHGTHARAASKAFTQLCKVKKIKGQCAMIITVRETTQNGDGKQLSYKLKRVKLDKPRVMTNGAVYEYETECHAHKGAMPPCTPKLAKSSGPMKSKHKSMANNKKTKKASKH